MERMTEIRIEGKVAGRVVGGATPTDVVPLLEGEQEVFLVYDAHLAPAASALLEAFPAIRSALALETSEEEKNMDSVLLIARSLLEAGASRKALLLAMGGGITTDVAGFAASVYTRGIRYANIPTTLLAQVDAGIGGKTGVNFEDYKNMLGVIVQPVFTFVCSSLLATLPRREFLSGASELLKTFLIEDRDGRYGRTVSLLSSGSPDFGSDIWQETVFEAASVKAGIVSRDPYEHGERRKLNLGHTFAHAIEHEARLRGDDITHGEAVSMGILLSARLSDRLGLSEGMEGRLRQDFLQAGLPVESPYPPEVLAGAMEKDKKAEGGFVHFVLLEDIGRVVVRDLSVAMALKALTDN